MTREALTHLARLSRIALTEDELIRFEAEISSILRYVGTVSAIVADDRSETPAVGPVFNVFRADTITHAPGEFSEVIMAAFPERAGRFLKVKKILDQHG
jgi:aspartyl-tRNA(Asn)/glutamyl-tRNA(Gln) amidotransferase subunit C